MPFDIVRTGRSVPSQGLGASANVDVSTGGQLVARAIGQAGEDLGDTAETLHRLQADNQFSEARRLANERLNLLADEFERNPDSTTYQELSDEALGEMKQFAPKNPLAARAYSQLLASIRVSGNKMVLASSLARERDLFAAGILADMAAGNYAGAEKKLRTGPRKGMMGKEEAQFLLAKLTKNEAEANQQARLHAELIKAKSLTTEDAALDYVDSLLGQIPNADVGALRTAITADWARKEKEDAEQEQQEIEDATADMIDGVTGTGKYEEEPYDITAILTNKNLTSGQKDTLIDKFKKYTAVVIPDESDPDAIDRVIGAIDAYAMGRTVTVDGVEQKATQEYARDVLANNLPFLDTTDRKKYRNDIYAATDPVYSSHRADGRNFLKTRLLTDRSALGISIPAGPQEKQHYQDALVELDIKLNQWKESGKWPDEKEFYAATKIIENKVKQTGYRIDHGIDSGRDAFILEGGSSRFVPRTERLPANDPFVHPYIQGLKRQGGFPTDGEEFIKIQLNALEDVWPDMNDASKKYAIDQILKFQDKSDIGKQLRNAFRK